MMQPLKFGIKFELFTFYPYGLKQFVAKTGYALHRVEVSLKLQFVANVETRLDQRFKVKLLQFSFPIFANANGIIVELLTVKLILSGVNEFEVQLFNYD